jgi:hypothetical protein
MAKRGRKPLNLTPALPARETSLPVGRKRKNDVGLPEHVHRVKSGSRTYFYYQVGRGKPKGDQGPRTPLGGNPYAAADDPRYLRFYAEVSAAAAGNVAYPRGSIGALVKLYRGDDAYLKAITERTQTVYDVHLNRFIAPERWGFLAADRLTPVAVVAARDALKDTPGMANQMLSIGRLLYDWAVPLGHVTISNPFAKVDELETADKGHVPWPRWAIEHALGHMPPDLVRMVRLGTMTCQRESDMIRLGPEHRDNVRGRPGIWCRAKKTRRKRKSVFIPLAIVDALEIDRWSTAPIAFTNSRWKAPIERFRDDLYLYSPKGAPYSPTSLRARYHRWLATKDGAELCRRWKAWLAEMVRKYEWEIDPDDAKGPTIHGLRGTGILLRFVEGLSQDQIGNDIGAHPSTVGHYMRFRDQMEVAASGRDRLRLVGDEG